MRRLHERGHAGTSELEPQHLVGTDLLAPFAHSVPECRDANGFGRNAMTGPTDEECMARSVVHHVAVKHGIDPSAVHDGVGKFGFTMAGLMKQAHDFVGLSHEVRADQSRRPESAQSAKGKSRKARATAFDGEGVADARDGGMNNGQTHLRRTSVSVDASGKTVQQEDRAGDEEFLTPSQERAHPAGRMLRGAAAFLSSGRGWGKDAANFASRVHSIARRKRTEQAATKRRNRRRMAEDAGGTAQTARTAAPTRQSHTAGVDTPSSVLPSLSTASSIAAFVAGAPNSITSRVAGAATAAGKALSQVGDIRAKVERVAAKTEMQEDAVWRKRSQRARRRQLGGTQLSAVLDEMHARFDSEKGARHGRTLKESKAIPNTPDWHDKNNGWVAAALDWRGMADEAHRLAAADSAKMRWWSEGAHGQLPTDASTGHALLDARIPPSTIGRSLRIVAHAIVQKVPEWEERERGRRLDEALAAANPRAVARGGNDELAWSELLSDHTRAALLASRLLERRDHRTVTRRLSEAFFNGVLAAPYAAYETSTYWGTYEASSVSYYEAILRYVVFDTALCYLYKSNDGVSDAQMGSSSRGQNNDGTTVRTHHDDRMCFPAIPFLPSRLPTFREATGTEGVDWNALSYDTACHAETLHGSKLWLLDKNFDLTSPWQGIALVMRTSEAVDSVRNFVNSGRSDDSMHAAAMLMCGVSQLGGILYVALLVPVMSLILICATPITAALVTIMRCTSLCLIHRWKGKKRAPTQARGTLRLPLPQRRDKMFPLGKRFTNHEGRAAEEGVSLIQK